MNELSGCGSPSECAGLVRLYLSGRKGNFYENLKFLLRLVCFRRYDVQFRENIKIKCSGATNNIMDLSDFLMNPCEDGFKRIAGNYFLICFY